jgi:putative FmdB family regulatory protein
MTTLSHARGRHRSAARPGLAFSGQTRTLTGLHRPVPAGKDHGMPIYEFECTDCGERFERLQKLSDPDPADCPACGKPHVKRRLTAPAFRLAGSGWYETDFKKDGDRKRNLAGKDEAPKSEAKDDGGAKKADEAKPAATPAESKDAKPAAPKPKSGGAANP